MLFTTKHLITFSLFLSLFFFTATSIQAASLNLSPSSGNYSPGNTFDVKINLNLSSGESVDGADALLVFNQAVLKINKITQGSLFSTYPQNTFSNDSGTIKVSGITTVGQPISTGGTLATITFQAKAGGEGKVTFDFTQGSTTDSNVAQNSTSNDILTSVTNATYTVANSSGGSSSVGGTSDGGDPDTLPVAGGINLTLGLLLGGMVTIGMGCKLLMAET